MSWSGPVTRAPRRAWARAHAAAPAGAQWSTERRVLLVVGLGTLMSAIDTTVTNLALHTVGRAFHTPVGDVQWVVTAYLLAIATVIPVSGWVARRLGSRRVYIVALALFAASSGLCAIADSLWTLVACRILQGMAAGLLTPLSQLIAAEVSGPDRMSRTMSRIWMITDVGLVAGPVLGGVLISGLGWRWIFLINVPVGVLATIAAIVLLPRMPARSAGRLDLGGLLRLSPGVLLLVLALAQAEQSGNAVSLAALAPLVAGLVLIGDFVRHALAHPRPLLNLRLYERPTFALGSLSLFCLNVAWGGSLVLVALYFQEVRHLSPSTTGLLLCPQGLGTIVGVWRAGRVQDPTRARWFGTAGLGAFLVVTVVFTRIGPNGMYWLILPLLVISGLAAGYAWVPATAAGYIDLSPEQISHASPLVAVMMRLGASFGTALAAIALQRGLDRRTSGPRITHLVAAYHGSFAWVLFAGGAALLLFVGLSRSEQRSLRRGRPVVADDRAVARSI
jgi:EmrB/QacA subfamily drug resistance transporter